MAKKANPNKAIYIDVASSVYDVRKDILNVNMEVINLLKKYEYFKELRQNKQKGFAILKEIMKEINNDFVKLKNDLPEIQPQREGNAAFGKIYCWYPWQLIGFIKTGRKQTSTQVWINLGGFIQIIKTIGNLQLHLGHTHTAIGCISRYTSQAV